MSGTLFQHSCQDTEKQESTGKMKEMQYKRALIKKKTSDEEKEAKAVAWHEKGGKMDRKTIAR